MRGRKSVKRVRGSRGEGRGGNRGEGLTYPIQSHNQRFVTGLWGLRDWLLTEALLRTTVFPPPLCRLPSFLPFDAGQGRKWPVFFLLPRRHYAYPSLCLYIFKASNFPAAASFLSFAGSSVMGRGRGRNTSGI